MEMLKWINLMEIYYQRSKLFSSKLKNYMEKISVQLKKIRGIFSAQTLVILLGRSCCTHIYCMTSEKHHKTSQVEKSHTQYKWPKQNDLMMGWIMYVAQHNISWLKFQKSVNFTKILTKIVQNGWNLYDIGWNRIFLKVKFLIFL